MVDGLVSELIINFVSIPINKISSIYYNSNLVSTLYIPPEKIVLSRQSRARTSCVCEWTIRPFSHELRIGLLPPFEGVIHLNSTTFGSIPAAKMDFCDSDTHILSTSAEWDRNDCIKRWIIRNWWMEMSKRCTDVN